MKLTIKSPNNQNMEPEPALPLAATSFLKKKLRSKQRRRRRSQIAPFVFQIQTIHLSVDSSSDDDASCDSNSTVSNLKKRKFDETKCSRRITRSSYKKETEAAEVSESSCVESNSNADFLVFGERSSKLKKEYQHLEKTEKNDAVSISLGAAAPARPDISGVSSKLSSEIEENDVVFVTSKFGNAIKENVHDVVDANFTILNSDSVVDANFTILNSDSVVDGNFTILNSDSVVDANFTISNSDSVVDQKPTNFVELDTSHLICEEELSLEEIVSDSSSSHESVFSELQSDIFAETWDLDFSDYTPSLSYDTGSQFSERSSNETPVSLARSLFLEFKQQFCRSASPLDSKFASRAEDERQIKYSTLVRFENEEDEESYTRLRERERRHVYMRNYAEEYGDLILQQRSFIVPWIVEECTAKEFQQETIFLGVGLLDRFLSKGFFRNKRSLRIVGIACLALAIRIEENQPYNSVRQRNFYIGTDTYSRNEVVAMEWLVMEVLNFQCFLPTMYNFLWFYLKAAKADAEVEKRAKYLAVVALSDHEQLRYWPSTVAAGVVIMACMDSNQHELYNQVIEIHIRTTDNDLPECMKSLDWLVHYIR